MNIAIADDNPRDIAALQAVLDKYARSSGVGIRVTSFMSAEELLKGYRSFLDTYPGADSERIPVPRYAYYGKEVWEQALTAILCGKNLLLAGGKATGKNVLAQNLAALFLRPMWNISLHVNTDAASLVGTDTFQDGAVTFRPGPVYQCGAQGGFGVLDEVPGHHAHSQCVRAEGAAGLGKLVQVPAVAGVIFTYDTGYIHLKVSE